MKPRGFEFEEVETFDPQKSYFDDSYINKFTTNWGTLKPFLVEETMPGDHFKMNSNLFVRLQPLLAPTMHRCDAFMYFFYVPNRLVWDNFKKFASNGDGSVKMADAKNYVPPAHPYIRPFDVTKMKLTGKTVWKHCYPALYIYQNASNTYNIDVVFCDNKTDTKLSSPDLILKDLALFDHFNVPFNYTLIRDTDGVTDYICVNQTIVNSLSTSFTVGNRFSLFGLPVDGVVSKSGGFTTGITLLANCTFNFTNADVDPDRDFINAIPFAAYNMIYNQYFRSQDYQDELYDKLSDGQNTPFHTTSGLNVSLQSKCFEHDYFTSLLPDCQRGPEVSLSLAGTAPLQLFGDEYTRFVGDTSNAQGTVKTGVDATDAKRSPIIVNTSAGNQEGQIDITPHTRVDLSGVSAITINALRYANALQRYEELLARSGSRYNETLISVYGVVSSDASIQRPIYLGGNRVPITISDVAQTSGENQQDSTPLGTLAGRGLGSGNLLSDFYCEEFGWIIGLVSIVPRTQYFQGLSRHMLKQVVLDYPVPLFAHLGEEEIRKSELYANGQSTDTEVLGYLPRYSCWKYHSDEIHGEMKGSLRYWSISRFIQPGVNGAQIDESFLRADTANYDAFAITDDTADHFILEVNNNVELQRSLPEYSTPMLM